MKFDRVILSCDDNPKFVDFWPIVSKAWNKLFGVKVSLAVVGASSEMFHVEHSWQTVMSVAPVENIPTGNQAKMARYFYATLLQDATLCMTNDMDLLPLQADYYNDLLRQRPKNHFMTIGGELYAGVEKGKFTAGYLTAESRIWRMLMNPDNLGWQDWIKSFESVRVFDDKEDIRKAVHHEHPDTFSDESVLRAMLAKNPVPCCHLRRGYDPYTVRAIDRAAWHVDQKKLSEGTYVEAHLLRPYAENKARIDPLLKHIGV
jgi:hypothetical protein